jgi:mRNA-degrading endonuclease RelE of RelBE toxin-antitoxin system
VPRVVLAHRAPSKLLQLNWPLIDAVEDALGLLEREPLSGHALHGRFTGLRSLRVGTFRIVYHLADAVQTVRVVAIRIEYAAHESGLIARRLPRSRSARRQGSRSRVVRSKKRCRSVATTTSASIGDERVGVEASDHACRLGEAFEP